MNPASNVILLPPPGAKRFGPEGMDGSRRFRTGAADRGAGFDAEQLAGLADALAQQGKGSTRKRSFADELYGETGRAPADIGFFAQRYAQETLQMAAHHEDWRQGSSAYARAQNLSTAQSGTFVAA
ncbi:MAG: hypothetical protein NBV67_02505 [Tagaea sp.]|nr:hypothetical protein [Tagaea sp.]